MELKTRIDSEILPFVAKASRYTGDEYNCNLRPTDSAELKIALCYADLYDAGIRNPGYELCYHFWNSRSLTAAERFYCPGKDAAALMKSHHIPLFSHENRTSLSDFQVLFFYLPDILSLTNILAMLDLAGIPFLRDQRGEEHPLILLTAPSLANPEPSAEFVDAAITQLDAKRLTRLTATLLHAGRQSWPKQRLLQNLAGLDGVYVPATVQPTWNEFGELRAVEPGLVTAVEPDIPAMTETERFPIKPLVPLADFGAYPVLWGNGYRRRYDQFADNALPRNLFPIYRGLGKSAADFAQNLIRRSGMENLSQVYSYDGFTVDQLWLFTKEKMLLEGLEGFFHTGDERLQIPVAKPSEVISRMKPEGARLYPGAASPSMRKLLNIQLNDLQFQKVVALWGQLGWANVYAYFLIGLPGEKESDLKAIGELSQRCQEVLSRAGDGRFLPVLEVFSPHPQTPLQWEKQADAAMLQHRQQMVEESLAGSGIRVIARHPFQAMLRGLLLRGDRRSGKLLQAAYGEGAFLDAWEESLDVAAWERAFTANGQTAEQAAAPISITVTLPWDHLREGRNRTALKEEKLRAFQGQLNPGMKEVVSIGAGIARDQIDALLSTREFSPGRDAGSGPGSGDLAEASPIQYGRRGRKRQLPTAIVKRKIRVRYSKTGVCRFLSHSEVLKVFERSARLAAIPLVYSQGQKPMPKLAYGQPLQPGVSSIAEYLDMEVEMGQEVDLKTSLNEKLPNGIQILQFQGILNKSTALAAAINRSEYQATFTEEMVKQVWIDEWLNQSEVWMERIVREEVRTIDVRPFVNGIELKENQLLVRIDIIEGRTAKITEVLESLLAPHGVDYRCALVQRTGQYIVDGNDKKTPFDIV